MHLVHAGEIAEPGFPARGVRDSGRRHSGASSPSRSSGSARLRGRSGSGARAETGGSWAAEADEQPELRAGPSAAQRPQPAHARGREQAPGGCGAEPSPQPRGASKGVGAGFRQGKKQDRLKRAQEAIEKAILVRDEDRKSEEGERRSKGYGFIAFKAPQAEQSGLLFLALKDHDSAMKTLQFLNDNPKVFGGERRPIVEFTIEDKRKWLGRRSWVVGSGT